MTEAEALTAFRSAHSIENMDAWGAGGTTEWIFSVITNGRIYALHRDSSGGWWYSVYFLKDGKRITEKQHIFGEKKKQMVRRYSAGRDEYYNPRG